MKQLIFEYGDKDVLVKVMETDGVEYLSTVIDIDDETGEETEREITTIKRFPIIKVPEMSEDIYLTVIEAEDITNLEDALKQPPLKMTFVGTYNEDGSQYVWTKPTEKQRNHSISKYKNKLNTKKTYDENGDIVDEREYTEEEAKSVQVNIIYGYNNRILD